MVRQAFILCGGSGSRLGALTAERPKPLLPVGDRPFLDVLLYALGRHGVGQVVLLAAFEAEQIQAYAKETPLARRFGIDVEVLVEPFRAGTGGALHHARGLADDEFLLLNGDSWFDVSFDLLSQAASADPAAAAILGLRFVADASRYGSVVLDGSRILQFHGDPTRRGSGLVNAGVYHMRRSIFRYLQPECSLELDVLPALARAGLLGGVASDAFFVDIGVPDAYAQAQTDVPARLNGLFHGA